MAKKYSQTSILPYEIKNSSLLEFCRIQRCASWYMNVRVDKILVFVCGEKYHESKDGIDNEGCL